MRRLGGSLVSQAGSCLSKAQALLEQPRGVTALYTGRHMAVTLQSLQKRLRSQDTAVIFDCDGTLVDSEWLCNVVLADSFRELGIIETAANLVSRYRGARMANILADVSRRHAVNIPPEFEANYRTRVASAFESDLKAIPGIEELVRALAARIPVAVASSAPRSKIELALRVTGLLDVFGTNLFSSYDIGSWKPAPDIYLHAAKTLGIPPARCLVIEDSLPGAQAATEAGMSCVLFDPQRLQGGEESSGVFLIHEISELTSLL